MNPELEDILQESARLFFLGLMPLLGLVCLGAVISSVLQSSIAVKDRTIGFGIRFLFLLFAMYVFLPAVISSVLELAHMAYGS